MSVTQIIDEIPKLTPAELREIRRAMIEAAGENADVAACDAAATEGAQWLDRMEAEDGGR